MRKSKLLLLFFFIIFLTTQTSYAQTSTIQGVVKDVKGQPVSGAVVTIDEKYDFTDIAGKFKIKGVEKGAKSIVIKSGKGSVAKTIQISESNQSEVFTFASEKDDTKNKENAESKFWKVGIQGKHDHTGELVMAPPKKAEEEIR